jgi:hypothetical protein
MVTVLTHIQPFSLAWTSAGEEMEDNTEEAWGEGDYQWISVNRYMYCDWKE